MEYGLGLILLIAVTGGAVAFIGDKLGSKIGKKRIRIFGMRPKNTSILVTVITGFLIAASTIGFATLLSKNVRTALFGMEKLKVRMQVLNNEVTFKNKELEEGKLVLKQKTEELNSLNDEVDNVKYALEMQTIQKRNMEGKLALIEKDYTKALDKLKNSQNEIEDLEKTKQELNAYISNLEGTKKQLEEDLTQMREEDLVFRNGEVLAGAIVRSNKNQISDEMLVKKFLDDLNLMVLKRMKIDKQETVIFVKPENVDEILEQIGSTKEKMLIRAIATGNVVDGQSVMVSLVAQPYKLIYEKDKVVYKEQIDTSKHVDAKIIDFLKAVNKTAREKGVLENPITGEVGSISGNELYKIIDEVKRIKEKVELQAYTADDIYTTGPLTIHVKVRRLLNKD